MKKRLLVVLAFATFFTQTTYTFQNFKVPFNLGAFSGLNGFNSGVFSKFNTFNAGSFINLGFLNTNVLSASLMTQKILTTARPAFGFATLAASTYLFNRFNNGTQTNQTILKTRTAIPLLFAGLCGVEFGLAILQFKPRPSTSLLMCGATAYLSGALASGYACSELLKDVSQSKKTTDLLCNAIGLGNRIEVRYEELRADAAPYQAIMADPEIPLETKQQLMAAELGKCKEQEKDLTEINLCFDELEDLGMSVKRYN